MQDDPEQHLDWPQGCVNHDSRVGVVRRANGENGENHVEDGSCKGHAQHESTRHTGRRLLVGRAAQIFAVGFQSEVVVASCDVSFYSITQVCSRCVNIHQNTRGPEHQQTLSAATAACECCSPENVACGRTERRRGSVAEYPRAYDCDKEEPKVGHARGARNNGLLRRASTAHFPARYVWSAAAHVEECKREQTGRIKRNSTFCWPTQGRAAARASARSCHPPA